MTASIDWGTIGELLWVAPVAAIAVSLAYSLLILGVSRAADARREGAGGVAALYGTLAIVAAVAFFGMVVFGITVIAAK
jgi:hypothetical protein